ETKSFEAAKVKSILANFNLGNDSFTLDESSLLVKPPLTCDGGGGSDDLQVKGTNGADDFTVSKDTVSLPGAGTLTYRNFESLLIDGLAGDDSFTVSEPLKLTTPATVRGGDGRDNVLVNGTGFKDLFTITAGKVGLEGAGDLKYEQVESLSVDARGG